MIKPVVLQQIVMNLSILTAVILSLHSFVANLTAGCFGVELRDTTIDLSNSSKGRSRPSSNRNASANRTLPRLCRDHRSHAIRDLLSRDNNDGSGFGLDQASKSKAWAYHGEANEPEDSDRRSEGSQENIIKRTVTWQVSTDAGSADASRGEDDSQTMSVEGELREARARPFVT